MSLLKKFRKLLLGDTEPSGGKIKVTEVSPQKSQKEGNRRNAADKGPAQAKREPDEKRSGTKPARQEYKPAQKSEYKPAQKSDYKPGDRPAYKPDDRPAYKPDERPTYRPARKPEEKSETAGEASVGERNPRRPRTQSRGQERGGERYGERGGDERRGRPYGGDKRRRRGASNEDNVPGVNPDGTAQADFGTWSVSDFAVEPEEGKLRFHDLAIPERIMKGVQEAGYKFATPIQALILPEAFKGSDVSGRAQTGTGKTAAFLITIFKHLLENTPEGERRTGTPRALIMAPTRELVIQIEKDARVLGKYCGLQVQSVFGGINYEKQRRQVEGRKIDVLTATPGRLLDFQEQGVLNLEKVEILVIDEADRMLDMGFIPDMRKIINSTPPRGKRQTMLFSATLSPEILRLAGQWTKDPLSFEVESKELTAAAIEQRAYIVSTKEKFALMYNMILSENLSRVIVFGNRRDEVSRLADMFKAADISCGILSGDVSQAKRIRTLEDLRNGRITVLAATDVAARGLHVDDISHVFNFTLPDDPEDYVHRIGRTGRAGATGVSVIFATEEDSYVIPQIERFTGHKLAYINPEQWMLELPPEIAKLVPAQKSFARPRGITKSPRSGGNGGGNSRGGRPPFRRSGR